MEQKKIISYLKKAGKRYPELLSAKFESVDLTSLELAIMKHRYIDGLFFKQIPACDDVRVGENWVFRVHKKALSKIVDKLNLADLLGLFMQ